MVIYLATNQGRSPKAVSEAHSPEKRCSHLDIHKEKKTLNASGHRRLHLDSAAWRTAGG